MSWLQEPAFEAERAEIARWAAMVAAPGGARPSIEVVRPAGLERAELDGVNLHVAGIDPSACAPALARVLAGATSVPSEALAGVSRLAGAPGGGLTPPHAWFAELPEAGVVVAARDPLGRLPLFWARSERGIALSADPELVVELAGLAGEPDRMALIGHLSRLWPDPAETYVAGISRVPAGFALVIAGGETELVRYWSPLDAAPPGSQRLDRDRFRGLLEASIEAATTPEQVAIYLSGGLDSVGVAALGTRAARRRGSPVPRAFSVGFAESDFDEVATQRAVGGRLGLRLRLDQHLELCDGDPIRATLELASTMPAPPQNLYLPAFLPLGRQAAAEGCTAVVTGTGGDEWLGVTPVLAADLLWRGDLRGVRSLYRTLHLSHPVSRLRAAQTVLWVYGVRSLLGTMLSSSRSRLAAAVLDPVRARRRAALAPWLAPGAEGVAELDRRTALVQASQRGRPGTLYAREMEVTHLEPIVSTEAEEHVEHARRIGIPLRHPYLDPGLVELLCAARPADLSAGGRSKAPLRSLVSEAFPGLGFERQRKPVGRSYVAGLVAGPGLAALRRLGGARTLGALGVVDPAGIDALAAAIAAGTAEARDPYDLWEVLCLEAWARPRLGS